MTIVRQPDIGKCDDCGDENAPRRKSLRDVTIGGEVETIEVYLCAPCRGAALALGNFHGAARA